MSFEFEGIQRILVGKKNGEYAIMKKFIGTGILEVDTFNDYTPLGIAYVLNDFPVGPCKIDSRCISCFCKILKATEEKNRELEEIMDKSY